MNSKELKSIAEAYAKMNIRGNDSEEQKKRLEKKRGMKLDDHPQFKKEALDPVGKEDGDVDNDGDKDSSDKYLMKRRKAIGKAMGKKKGMGEQVHLNDISKTYLDQVANNGDEVVAEADSLAAMQARREKRLAAQRKREGTTATGRDFGHDYSLTPAQQKARRDAEFKAGIGTKKEEVENVDEALTGQRQMRARDMKGTPYQKGGGKRTARDNKTLHNLATRNEGPGTPGYEKKSTGGKGGKKFAGYGDQGAGNKAARRAGNEPMRGNRDPRNEELEATGLFSEKEIAAIEEAMSSYDRNRKRAAQRAADRNAARAAGKTGVVPGVGYVSPRKEKESYTDEKGTERHKSGAKMP